MVRTCRLDAFGGPEVIQWVDEKLPPPGANELRIRNTAIGLNFIDIYHRSGAYPIPLPSGLGLEAAGVVEAIGEDVSDFEIGQRICTFGPQLGAYSEARNIPAASLFHLPANVSDEIAAAALLKACTVEFLVERCAKVQAGWQVLVHAAAGGVGLLLVQWLKHIGAEVIGTVSSQDKAAEAMAAGADHIILSSSNDIAAQILAITGGRGVRVAFDGIGATTWETSLSVTASRGIIVSYGSASGAVTGVSLGTLATNGSLFVTRPTLFDYYAAPEERKAGAARVFELLEAGILKVSINQRYALADAAQAHKDLADRKTTGSSILLP